MHLIYTSGYALLRPVDQVVMLFNDQVLMLLEFNKLLILFLGTKFCALCAKKQKL